MSPSISNEDVVLRGTFLYAGTVECDIKVVRSPVRFGSGDHEDSTEEREDSKHETFYVWYGSATERGVFNAGGGGFSSLTSAVAHAESAPGIGATIRWNSSNVA